MSSPHYSDEEVIELHDQIREASAELQRMIDELLHRVVQKYEGTQEHAGAIEALAKIQSIRDDHRGIGLSSEPGDRQDELDERQDG